jgi:hypothetical protein
MLESANIFAFLVLLIRILTEGLGYRERFGNWLTTSGFLRRQKSVSIKAVPSIVQRYRFEAPEARDKEEDNRKPQRRNSGLDVTAFRPLGYAEVVRAGLRATERVIAVHRPRRTAEAFEEQSGLKWTSHGVQMKSAPLSRRNFGPALDLEVTGHITSANPAAMVGSCLKLRNRGREGADNEAEKLLRQA